MSRPTLRAAAWVAIPWVVWLTSCRSRSEDPGARVDRALGAASRSLIAGQSPDGAWRSSTYGVFKDGLSLTPAVLKALTFGPDVPGSAIARRRGAEYLIARIRADGSIDGGPFGMTYPVYTASAAVIALTFLNIPDSLAARDAWLRDLRRRQLTEELGWEPGDPAFGGWGYSIEPPSRAATVLASDHPIDADLSSTLFAIGALRIAGVPADDPVIRKALTFIERCQNVVLAKEVGQAIRSTTMAASSSRRPTRCATRPGPRARIDKAGCVTTPMAARRPTGCGHFCAVASPGITRGSWPPEDGWRSISRPHPIPVRSRVPAKATAMRRISTMRGRSPMHSVR